MTELSDIDRLRKGEKILCHTCHKHFLIQREIL